MKTGPASITDRTSQTKHPTSDPFSIQPWTFQQTTPCKPKLLLCHNGNSSHGEHIFPVSIQAQANSTITQLYLNLTH